MISASPSSPRVMLSSRSRVSEVKRMRIRAAEELLQIPRDGHEPGLGDHQLAGQIHQVVEPVAVDPDRLGNSWPCQRCREVWRRRVPRRWPVRIAGTAAVDNRGRCPFSRQEATAHRHQQAAVRSLETASRRHWLPGSSSEAAGHNRRVFRACARSGPQPLVRALSAWIWTSATPSTSARREVHPRRIPRSDGS